MLSILLALAAPMSDGVYESGVAGTQIAESCANAHDNTEINLCSSYALGTFDAMSDSRRICGMPGINVAQIVAIARKAFADHPEDWSRAPVFVLRRAFVQAFPCR